MYLTTVVTEIQHKNQSNLCIWCILRSSLRSTNANILSALSLLAFFSSLFFGNQVTQDQYCVYFSVRNWRELDDYAVVFWNGKWSRWHSYNFVSQMLHRQSQHTLCLSVTDGKSRLKLKKYARAPKCAHALTETLTHAQYFLHLLRPSELNSFHMHAGVSFPHTCTDTHTHMYI